MTFNPAAARSGARSAIVAAILLCSPVLGVASAAAQDECAANFKAVGDPRNGASYVTFVTLPNLDPHSALGQMQKIALERGFTLGAESYSGNEGNLTIIQNASLGLIHTRQGYPILIKADQTTNQLWMALKLNQEQKITADSMRATLCGMLTRVTMDAAGAALAADTHAQSHSDQIINVKAIDLADEIHKAMFWHNSASQTIGARYVGRTYRIDGQVFIAAAGVNRAFDDMNGVQSFDILYITAKPGLLVGKRDQPIQIGCHTDAQQRDRFRALNNNDYATLIGTVTQFAGNGLRGTLYMNCRFEN
jgi:hypothetical protein